jgi:hypothetical protein
VETFRAFFHKHFLSYKNKNISLLVGDKSISGKNFDQLISLVDGAHSLTEKGFF